MTEQVKKENEILVEEVKKLPLNKEEVELFLQKQEEDPMEFQRVLLNFRNKYCYGTEKPSFKAKKSLEEEKILQNLTDQ